MEQTMNTEKQTAVTALMHFIVRLPNSNNSVLALWYYISWVYCTRALKPMLGHSQLLATMGMEKSGLDPAHTGKSLSTTRCCCFGGSQGWPYSSIGIPSVPKAVLMGPEGCS